MKGIVRSIIVDNLTSDGLLVDLHYNITNNILTIENVKTHNIIQGVIGKSFELPIPAKVELINTLSQYIR